MNLKLTVRQNLEPIEILKAYLNEIDKYKPLTKEEESALFDIIEDGYAAAFDMNYCTGHEGEPEYQERIKANKERIRAEHEAKEKVILSNQKFIYAVAKRICQDEGILDLINEGNLGMIKAFDDYDRSKGTRFITHASWYIERNMNNFQNNTRLLIRRPNNIISNTKVVNFEDKFFAENGRAPEQEETFDAMREQGNYFPEKEDMYGISFCPIYKNPDNDGDSCEDDTNIQPIEYINVTSEYNEYEETIEDEHNKQQVEELMSVLTEKEKEVISLFYGLDSKIDEEMSNKEIGFKLGLSSERIRQIKNTALSKMREAALAKA